MDTMGLPNGVERLVYLNQVRLRKKLADAKKLGTVGDIDRPGIQTWETA